MTFVNTKHLLFGRGIEPANACIDKRPMKTIVQRVYEYVVTAERVVTSRELVSALPDANHSSVTFALSRLVREKAIDRVGYGQYRAAPLKVDDDRALLDSDDAYLEGIFEAIRPALSFHDLAFLFEVVGAARRIAPEAFREARRRGRRTTPTS